MQKMINQSENLKRVVVSLIAIPIILIATYLGGYYFFAFVAVIGLISFFEFSLFAKNKGANVNLLLGATVIFIFLINQFIGFVDLITIIVLSSLLLLTVELFRNKGSAIINLGATFLGIFYIGVFSVTLISLREFYPSNSDLNIYGAYLIISILASIWIGDSAAYYGGITLGKHKLFSRVSPKKSWEGAIFGFIFSVGVMILAKVLVLNFLSWVDVLVIGIIIGTIGQIGDLVESLLKRDSEVKDSSSLIPGHGGFFDRFDSLFFCAPAIWIYLKYFV
ncbi:MAG: phosphatidate cytidylyltransferase [Ignavibacteriaceae bacterium]|nr:phosphatidate cytidylyltransferase [Ignavibacteriaceae bacterium]